MNLPLAVQRFLGLVRLARNLPGFLGEVLTPEQAREMVAEGVRLRRERFLARVEAIHASRRGPYYALLEAAGCEPGDVRKLTESEGLEGALRRLAAAGVYVRYEEFKGRQAAVRGSRTFRFRPEEFDDPNLKPEMVGASGGSRGRAVTTYGSLAYITQMVPHWAVFFEENDCLDKPLIFWTPGHAGATVRHLWCAKFGIRYERWFVSEEMTAPKDRLYAAAKRWLVERQGGFPKPEPAHYDQPEIVLDALLPYLERGGAALNTAPSAAVKLSLAAQARGRSLQGIVFLLGAEPLTPARKRAIEASGARATPLYGASEATWIGGQCRRPAAPDEIHVLRDNYAVIAAEEALGEAAPASDDGAVGLLLTTLQPLTQKTLINVDIGDRAVIERRRCDCLYDRLGCTTVLHTIRSSDKITEYGVNIAVADVFQVLEEALPRRFGGAAGDYQLVESPEDSGLPRYTLYADPRVGRLDEGEIEATFLSELARLRTYYGYMTEILRKERALTVRRATPVRTARGKAFAFYRLPAG